MGTRRIDELGSLQQQVMECLWTVGEATVHDIRDRLNAGVSDSDEDQGLAYTTVLSVLQKLEKAEWVGHRKEGRSHVYAASVSRRQAKSGSIRNVLDRVFGGDPKLLLQHLIDDERVDPEVLRDMRALLDARRSSSEGEHHVDE